MIRGDDTIDEFSRHVLVPEIGPAGQARLLATRVRVGGEPASRALVAELLARSGLVLDAAPPHAAVMLGAAPAGDAPSPTVVGWGSEDVVHASVLVARPCPACAVLPPPQLPRSAVAVHALAALVATVLVLHVVRGATASTDVRLTLPGGPLVTQALAGRGCGRCAPADASAR
jgi:hypothetical protein